MNVRPSALAIAERCSLSVHLAAQFPEGSEAAEAGTSKDLDISMMLVGGYEPTTDLARSALEWVRKMFGDSALYVQRKVALRDPFTGKVITEGTPDLFGLVGAVRGRLILADWKAEGQVFQGRIPHPDDNIQLLTYAVAAAIEFGADSIQVNVVPLGEDAIGAVIPGRVWMADEWDAIIDRVRAINKKADKPEARKGPHCAGCYSRSHCPAYMLAAYEGETALVQYTKPGELTANDVLALEAFEGAAKEFSKQAWARVEAQVRAMGPLRDGDRELAIIATKGKRRGPTVGELEAGGHPELIKEGKPGEKLDWRKADPLIEKPIEELIAASSIGEGLREDGLPVPVVPKAKRRRAPLDIKPVGEG